MTNILKSAFAVLFCGRSEAAAQSPLKNLLQYKAPASDVAKNYCGCPEVLLQEGLPVREGTVEMSVIPWGGSTGEKKWHFFFSDTDTPANPERQNPALTSRQTDSSGCSGRRAGKKIRLSLFRLGAIRKPEGNPDCLYLASGLGKCEVACFSMENCLEAIRQFRTVGG